MIAQHSGRRSARLSRSRNGNSPNPTTFNLLHENLAEKVRAADSPPNQFGSKLWDEIGVVNGVASGSRFAVLGNKTSNWMMGKILLRASFQAGFLATIQITVLKKINRMRVRQLGSMGSVCVYHMRV